MNKHPNIAGWHVFALGIFICWGSVNASAQNTRNYRPHEEIEIGNGQKIEILSCVERDNEVMCDVIYFTDKRQNGTRKWEKKSLIVQLEQSAQQAVNAPEPKKAEVKTATKYTKPPGNKPTEKKIPEKKVVKNDPPIIKKDSQVIKPTPIITTPRPEPAIAEQQIKASDSIIAEKPAVKSTVISTIGYSLDDCFAAALTNNIDLKKAQNLVDGNNIGRQTARYNILPSLSYNVGHYFSFGKNIDPVTNTFVNETFSGGYTSLNLQLNLFSGFSRINTIRQSTYNIQAASYAKKQMELELFSNISLAYARLVFNKEQVAATRTNMLTTLKELDIISEKIKVGKNTKFEFFTFNGRLSSLQADLVTYQNDSTAATQDLKQFLNLPYNYNLDVRAIDTALLESVRQFEINPMDFVDQLMQSHPAIKKAQMDEDAARMAEKIARSNAYPSLAVGGNLVSNYNISQMSATGTKIPLGEQLNNNLGQNVNISLRVPLFSQLETTNRIKKEKINISNAQLDLQKAQNIIASNALQLISDFKAAKQKYYASQTAYLQNQLSLDLYQEKYRLGLVSSVELLTATDLLNNAQSKFILAKLDYYFRYKILNLLRSV